MALVRVVGPTLEPISIAEAKDECRIFINDDDAKVASAILFVREFAEDYLGRRMMTQTWDYILDRLHYRIHIPIGPVQSVTTFSYIDQEGITRTLADPADYQLDKSSDIARIRPDYTTNFPVTRFVDNAVTIRVVVGYGSNPSDIPEPIRAGMMVMIQARYENDTALLAAGKQILQPYRVYYA